MTEYIRKPNPITDQTGQYAADVTSGHALKVTDVGGVAAAVELLGGGTLFADQVTLSAATATQLVNVDATRSGIAIVNLGTNDVYIGSDNTVDASNGFLLLGLKGAVLSIPTSDAVWAFAAAGATVSVMTVSQ